MYLCSSVEVRRNEEIVSFFCLFKMSWFVRVLISLSYLCCDNFSII